MSYLVIPFRLSLFYHFEVTVRYEKFTGKFLSTGGEWGPVRLTFSSTLIRTPPHPLPAQFFSLSEFVFLLETDALSLESI